MYVDVCYSLLILSHTLSQRHYIQLAWLISADKLAIKMQFSIRSVSTVKHGRRLAETLYLHYVLIWSNDRGHVL